MRSTSPQPSANTTSTPPRTPAPESPPAAARREIELGEVTGTNPIAIKGTARTFENNVALRIRDAQGLILKETFATSVGDSGQYNPFSTEVYLTRNPGSKVTVEALEYSAKDGSERSLVAKTVPYDTELAEVSLFFPRNDCTPMYQYRRKVPKSIGAARLLAEALVQGPVPTETSAGATNPFPRGSAVRSVILRDGILTVDFNERLQNVGGSCAVTAIRSSVEQTMKTLPNVREVVITASGSRELALQP